MEILKNCKWWSISCRQLLLIRKSFDVTIMTSRKVSLTQGWVMLYCCYTELKNMGWKRKGSLIYDAVTKANVRSMQKNLHKLESFGHSCSGPIGLNLISSVKCLKKQTKKKKAEAFYEKGILTTVQHRVEVHRKHCTDLEFESFSPSGNWKWKPTGHSN